jgi:cation diffusion facilitator family transporter
MRRRPSQPKKVIYAALAGNCFVAVTKFVAAAYTGSAAMLAEGVHSLVDTANEGLLLYGLRSSGRRPTAERPFGYGRELYFWTFIVALLVFTLGAGVAVLEGLWRLLFPHPIENAYVSYIVIALAFIFEGSSWWIAVRHLGPRSPGAFVEAFRRTKDPTSFMVLFEDSAALLGLSVALVGTFATSRWQIPAFDGVASIIIGLILGTTAVLLTVETKSLLIGEPARSSVLATIRRLAEEQSGVHKVNGLLTTHLAPDEIVAALSIEFDDKLTTSELEALIGNIERTVRAAHPEIISIFVKPQTPMQFQAARRRRGFPDA